VLVLTFSDMAGRPVRQLKIRRAAARKATFEVRGVAAAGRYRWTLTAGRKVLRRATVATTPAAGLNLSPDATLAAIVG
jgi:hypothetical protein